MSCNICVPEVRTVRNIVHLATRCAIVILFAITLPSNLNAQAKKPNTLLIFGDDIGQTNISAYGLGVVGYKTPNIDRIAREGMMFTDYYAENSCTAGLAEE